ncbi:MAG: CPBP family intramembrane metalloprotease [Anaerolineae bacterium]|nr:CPBP family intramembrane metalloprotease [Phycisphaerae bacterium]
MSISIVAAAAATTMTTQPMTSRGEISFAAILLMVSLTIAFFAGAFRRDSVLGPLRLDESDSPLRMLSITFLGIAFWFGLGGMYLALVHGNEITAARQRNLEFTLPLRENVIVNVAATAIALIAVLRADQILLRDGIRKLGFTRRDLPPGVVAGFVGAAIAIPLTFAMSIFVTNLWSILKLRPPQEHQLIRMLFDDPDQMVRWLVVVSAVIVAPLFEETIFRGHIQSLIAHTIRRYRGMAHPFEPIARFDAPWIRWLAICVSAALFAVIHEAGWMMPPLFVLAVCFGYVYERTGKLWAPILMHALFNATSITLALFTHT